jgi:D-glycero-D-manno-heptose 1,7-bisphosphate phosphatase
MRRAVFLDRDGVLNRPLIRDGLPYAPTSLDGFELLPGVEAACALLKSAGYLLVLATNQPDVGRGTMSRDLVESMHAKLLSTVPLDRIEVSYAAGAAFGEPSEFRKPKPGMLKHAATELGIDLGQSWMIGDRWRDISAGHAAGCRTILIDYGYSEEFPDPPDFSVRSLGEAAEIILRVEKPHAT